MYTHTHLTCDRPRRSVAKRSYASPKVWGGGPEEQPQVQEMAAAWAQESRNKVFHVQGQEGRQ